MRDYGIRLLALTISLGLHGAWLVKSGGTTAVMQPLQQPSQSVTRLAFAAPRPLPEEPAAKPEPVVEPLPEPVVEPLVEKPKPVKKKIEKKVAEVKKPKPKKRVEKEVVPEPPEEPAETESPAEPVQMAAAAEEAAAPAVDPGLLEDIRQRYLAELMAHIEEHKWYPKSARRRGIQGEVKVSFLLLPDGSIRDVEVRHGPKVLTVAAAKAVARAEPMPAPPAEVHCPLRCEFSMRYALN